MHHCAGGERVRNRGIPTDADDSSKPQHSPRRKRDKQTRPASVAQKERRAARLVKKFSLELRQRAPATHRSALRKKKQQASQQEKRRRIDRARTVSNGGCNRRTRNDIEYPSVKCGWLIRKTRGRRVGDNNLIVLDVDLPGWVIIGKRALGIFNTSGHNYGATGLKDGRIVRVIRRDVDRRAKQTGMGKARRQNHHCAAKDRLEVHCLSPLVGNFAVSSGLLGWHCRAVM